MTETPTEQPAEEVDPDKKPTPGIVEDEGFNPDDEHGAEAILVEQAEAQAKEAPAEQPA